MKGGDTVENKGVKRIIDRDKLKVRTYEKGYNFTYLAKILNITRATMSGKMVGRCAFNESEIYQLYKIFGTKIFAK